MAAILDVAVVAVVVIAVEVVAVVVAMAVEVLMAGSVVLADFEELEGNFSGTGTSEVEVVGSVRDLGLYH